MTGEVGGNDGLVESKGAGLALDQEIVLRGTHHADSLSLPGPPCDFCPCRRDELVELGLLEPLPGEGPLASVCERIGLDFGYEGDRAATEASARETSSL